MTLLFPLCFIYILLSNYSRLSSKELTHPTTFGLYLQKGALGRDMLVCRRVVCLKRKTIMT